jgi:hypothetical protein
LAKAQNQIAVIPPRGNRKEQQGLWYAHLQREALGWVFFPENKVLSAHRHSLWKTGCYFLFLDSHRFLPPLD